LARQADSWRSQTVAVLPKQQGNDQQRNDGERNQQADFPFGGRIRKNLKRRARVFGVDDAKKSRNDRNAVVQGKPARDRPLAGAIESDDEQRDQEMIFAHEQKSMTGKLLLLIDSLSRLREVAVTRLQFL